MVVVCPYCLGTALIRTSQQSSELTKEITCQCRNLECGHTFVAIVEVVRTLSPSAIKNPSLETILNRHPKKNKEASLTA